MKRFAGIIICLLAAAAAAGEIYFIPGWYSEWKSYERQIEILRMIFPGDTIHIRKWESNRLWGNAKTEAEEYAVTLAKELESRHTADITIIGHSLGGRIALDCAAYFARCQKQLRRIILLGTADNINEKDIANCQAASILPVINIFCIDDNMLKLFLSREGFHPLGLTGLPHPVKHFRQYRMKVPYHHIRVFQIPVIHRTAAEPFRETAAHLSPYYLNRLKEILDDPAQQQYIDLAALEERIAADPVKKDFYPGFFKIDEFDGWKLYRRRYPLRFRIVSPTGKKFYLTSESSALTHFAELKADISNR